MLNDDGIFEEQPFHVREHLGQREDFLGPLAHELGRSNVQNPRERQLRDNILRTIFRLHQYKPEVVGPVLLPVLHQHKVALE